MFLPKKNTIKESFNISKIKGDISDNCGVSLMTKQMIVNVIEDLMQNEIDIERLKNILNNNPSFSVEDSFDLIKNPNRDYMLILDIKRLFSSCNYFVTDDELNLLFTRFDKDNDGCITFNEVTKKLKKVYQRNFTESVYN